MNRQEEAKKVMEEADLLVSGEEIVNSIKKMGKDITEKLQNENPVMLSIMNGGLIFAGQLLTELKFPLEIDYVHATRYGNNVTGSALNWLVTPQTDLTDRVVVLLDDILDEGLTLACLVDYCLQKKAKKVYTAVLVDKMHNNKCEQLKKADFTGVEVIDRFLFGYGMDFKGYWRNAFGIYAVKGM